MRILHTADWHLGKLVYGVSMLEDQEAFLEETLYPVIEQERPDCLVLSGDIFDRSIAPPQAIRLFEACVLKLCKTYRLPLLAISGNHDGADRIAPAAQLLREQGVYIATKIEDAFSPIALERMGPRTISTCSHILSPPSFGHTIKMKKSAVFRSLPRRFRAYCAGL